uniref:Arf-GAP domain and FG repeat-containing protein 1 n=1 Tax=Bactrocera latifrons TaxID=174628 RepID=A0A0K8UA75_BACLA
MAAVVRKKQDDKYLQVLRELVTNGGGNRQCFDCGQKGPTYVNMTIGSFVCTRCSGVLRGLTPPHRVKSISMATFTQDDVDFLKSHGNDECAKTWLGLWDPKRAVHQDQRELMIDKYERKRYYLEPASPLKSLTNAVSLKNGSVTASAAGAGVEVATTSGVRATVATGNSSAATTSNGSSTYKSNGDGQIDFVHVSNGFGHIGHNTKNQYKNGERSFHLTPPSTQRTTMNGLHKSVTTTTVSAPNSSGKSTSAISRPQQHQQNGYNHLQDAFMPKNNNINNNGSNKNNELNVLHMTSSRMSDSSSSTSVNGFGADADFVADFGSANIFDATTTSVRNKISSPPILNGGGNAISSNGYARIQPLKKQQQQYQLLNGHGQTNGNSSHSDTIDNGTSENFADFEHAPIFNAAENYSFIRKTVIKRCAGGQQKDSKDSKQNSVQNAKSSEVPTDIGSSGSAAEDELDKNLYADIRQATTHSDAAESDNKGNLKSNTAVEQNVSDTPIKPAKIENSVEKPPTQALGSTMQNAVSELTSQLINSQSCPPDQCPVHQADYCGYCAPINCVPPSPNMCNQQALSQPPNQDQGNFCANNMPQVDWCQFANNPPFWPSNNPNVPGSTATTPDIAAAPKSLNTEPQQCPPIFCPQPQFYGPTGFATSCSPNICTSPMNRQPPQVDATIAGLSYAALPQQTILNTAQNRPQNGCDTNAEACLEPTPSYSTLYNRSYCQPHVSAYSNPFIQQTQMQTSPMPVPPECFNPFHPNCISGSCTKGCMPSNSIPVGDPIIDPSCNLHSPYSNCFCSNWCLPIPNNNNNFRTMNNQHNNSHNNNNNNTPSSTPSEDRYAALKDLDEQLRESKAAATVVNAYSVDVFGNNGISNGVNPFKHQQANPFQAGTHGTSPTATQNYFGQMTVISNGNGIPSHPPSAAAQFYYNTNGFGNAATSAGTATAMFPHTVIAAGPSGCGFGLGALQPTAIAATGAGGGAAFNNPFTASGAMSTNNPFL